MRATLGQKELLEAVTMWLKSRGLHPSDSTSALLRQEGEGGEILMELTDLDLGPAISSAVPSVPVSGGAAPTGLDASPILLPEEIQKELVDELSEMDIRDPTPPAPPDQVDPALDALLARSRQLAENPPKKGGSGEMIFSRNIESLRGR